MCSSAESSKEVGRGVPTAPSCDPIGHQAARWGHRALPRFCSDARFNQKRPSTWHENFSKNFCKFILQFFQMLLKKCRSGIPSVFSWLFFEQVLLGRFYSSRPSCQIRIVSE
jgi:hypothetical protein